jgi:hypothetical protein
MRSN